MLPLSLQNERSNRGLVSLPSLLLSGAHYVPSEPVQEEHCVALCVMRAVCTDNGTRMIALAFMGDIWRTDSVSVAESLASLTTG